MVKIYSDGAGGQWTMADNAVSWAIGGREASRRSAARSVERPGVRAEGTRRDRQAGRANARTRIAAEGARRGAAGHGRTRQGAGAARGTRASLRGTSGS